MNEFKPPMKKSASPPADRVRQRTQALRERIGAMGLVASGTLHVRTKLCGRKNCRCAVDPGARHGPYPEWSRRRDGRLVHTVLTDDQAALLAAAIDNYHEIQLLLEQWERETEAELLGPNRSNRR